MFYLFTILTFEIMSLFPEFPHVVVSLDSIPEILCELILFFLSEHFPANTKPYVYVYIYNISLSVV